MSSRRRSDPEAAPQSLASVLSTSSPFRNSQSHVSKKVDTVAVKDDIHGKVDAMVHGQDIDMRFMLGRTKKMPSMKIDSMELNSELWMKNGDFLSNRIFVRDGKTTYVAASDEMTTIAKIFDGVGYKDATKVSLVPEEKDCTKCTIDAMIHFFDKDGTNLCTCKMSSDPPLATLYVMSVMTIPVTAENYKSVLDEEAKWMAFAVFSAKYYDDPRFNMEDPSLDMRLSVRESTRESQRGSMRASQYL